MCVFRKRGGAANTGPGRVTELHLTQFPAYISLSSRREAKPRFGSKPANDDRANLCPLYILIVLSPPLFANRRPEQRRWNYSYFFEDRSRQFIPLFFLSLFLPLLSFSFSPSFQTSAGKISFGSFVDQFLPRSSSFSSPIPSSLRFHRELLRGEAERNVCRCNLVHFFFFVSYPPRILFATKFLD